MKRGVPVFVKLMVTIISSSSISAQNIKHDSESLYAYFRSKQNVQEKVNPLEGCGGNKITEGFLMAENLNEYFSSVFTREDISALSV